MRVTIEKTMVVYACSYRETFLPFVESERAQKWEEKLTSSTCSVGQRLGN